MNKIWLRLKYAHLLLSSHKYDDPSEWVKRIEELEDAIHA